MPTQVLKQQCFGAESIYIKVVTCVSHKVGLSRGSQTGDLKNASKSYQAIGNDENVILILTFFK